MIVNSTNMVKQAYSQHYAIAAFNVNNLEWAKAILLAAQEAQAPVILQVTAGAAHYMGSFRLAYDLIVDLHQALHITVPVAIHLDHGGYTDVLKTLGVGYTSVMFDGSSLKLTENIKLTDQIVKLAKPQAVTVEAEVGTIGGQEDGTIAQGELASLNEAIAMAKTGVDMLALGIGNIHGPYPDNWEGLNLAHLRTLATGIEDAIKEPLPLVLHGGSGIPDDQIKAAIQLGIAKINVNTEGQLAFHEAMRDYVLSGQDLVGKNYDPRRFLQPGLTAIKEMCLDRIRVFGSANRV